jgi:hypothetical protein
MNATDLKAPMVQPYFARSYHAFRDMFNFDAQEVSVMAWNGSNGLYANQPGYLPYTAWRNTPAEAAMRDFMVTHFDLPRGARLWSFGAPGYADDDGWRLERGVAYARGGYLDLEFDAGTAALIAPPDQVLRAAKLDSLVLGLHDTGALARVQVFARIDGGSPWQPITARMAATTLQRVAGGLRVPLNWPVSWRAKAAIAEQLKVVLEFQGGTSRARVGRIALYPANVERSKWRAQRRTPNA